MEVESISQSAQMLGDLLQVAAAQATEVASDLIAIGAEQTIDINQLETMGNVVDMYV